MLGRIRYIFQAMTFSRSRLTSGTTSRYVCATIRDERLRVVASIHAPSSLLAFVWSLMISPMGLAKGDATRVSIWVMASGGVLARTVFRSPSTTGPLPSLSTRLLFRNGRTFLWSCNLFVLECITSEKTKEINYKAGDFRSATSRYHNESAANERQN